MEIFHIVLASITGIYMILCSYWDLKNREIYTFPSVILTLMWMVYTLEMGAVDNKAVFIYVTAISVLMVTFNILHIWGGGDSDLLLLYGVVFLGTIKEPFVIGHVITLCLGLVAVLVVAILVGMIEAKVKKERLEKGSSIAVAPGYAAVISLLMIGGFIGC